MAWQTRQPSLVGSAPTISAPGEGQAVAPSDVRASVLDPAYGALPLSLVIVLAAATFAAWQQGAYYGHDFAIVEGAVAIASIVSAVRAVVVRRRRHRGDDVSHAEMPASRAEPATFVGDRRGAAGWRSVAHWAPAPAVAALVGLGVSTALSGLVHHQLRAASSTFGILAAAAAVAVMVATSSGRVQQTMVVGLVGLGALVALTGWWGVATHRSPWSLVDGGLWRAASSITYANATAAVCVPLALVALSQLAVYRSPRWSVAAAVLITGAAATLSRAGGLAFGVGLVVLLSFHDVAALAGAAWPAIVGAGLATAGLAGSFPATQNGVATPGHLGVATVTAAAGLALAYAGARHRLARRNLPVSIRNRSTPIGADDACKPATSAGRVADLVGFRRRWLVIAAVVVAAAGLLAFAGSAVRKDRLSTQSPDRVRAWRATWDLARTHPWTGVGPGSFAASWTTSTGDIITAEYTHNEYLQLVAQQGVLGAGALVLGLGAMTWLIWRRRPRRRGPHTDTARFGRWVGVVAALCALGVHSAFDFLWHIPLIPLIGAALAGMVLAGPTTEVTE